MDLRTEENKHVDEDASPDPNGLMSRMVLVAGTGRSGTTWLGKILDSNPTTFYKSEPDNRNRYPWFRDIPSRLEPTPDFDPFRQPFLKAVDRAYWAYSPNLNERPDFAKAFLRPRALCALRFGMRAWRKIARGRVCTVTLPSWVFQPGAAAPLLVIKSVVSNLRLTWLRRHFPRVRTILIVRHPGGYLNSIFKGARFEGWVGVGTKERLRDTVLPLPLQEHAQYTDAFEHGSDFERELIYWIVANETPILKLADWPNLRIVVYEELCRRPLAVARAIFHFLGLPFADATARFVEESTRAERSGFHSVYKNPSRSANKWRHELPSEQQSLVNRYLRSCALGSLWGGPANDRVAPDRILGHGCDARDDGGTSVPVAETPVVDTEE